MSIAATYANTPPGDSPPMFRGELIAEPWNITGSTGIPTDTCTITPNFIKQIQSVIAGGFTYTVSSGVITLTALDTLGNGVTGVLVVGLGA